MSSDKDQCVTEEEAAWILLQLKYSNAKIIKTHCHTEQTDKQQTTALNNIPQPAPAERRCCSRDAKAPKVETAMVSIGPNNTRIPAKVYESINWSKASRATRKLLRATFDRNVLATHSMTGKPSPAFKSFDKPIKGKLDPCIIEDIIHVVHTKCNVSKKEVRNAITTKCADETKMRRLRLKKPTKKKQIEKENQNQEI